MQDSNNDTADTHMTEMDEKKYAIMSYCTITLIKTFNNYMPVKTHHFISFTTVESYLTLNQRSFHFHVHKYVKIASSIQCAHQRCAAYLNANTCTGTHPQCTASSLTQWFSLTSQTCLKRQTDSSEHSKQPVGSLI